MAVFWRGVDVVASDGRFEVQREEGIWPPLFVAVMFALQFSLDNCSAVANFIARVGPLTKKTGGKVMAEWNPVDEMEALRREIDRAFDGLALATTLQQVAFLPGRGPRRYPLINLLEDKDHVYIEALTPGWTRNRWM